MGKLIGMSFVVLSLTGTFLAAHAIARQRPSKNNRPKLIAVDAREEAFGCPVGWKSEVHPIAWLSANCYLNHLVWDRKSPKWAHAKIERLDTTVLPHGDNKKQCGDYGYCAHSLKQLLQDKQQCSGGTDASKAYGWCGRFVGTMKVAGSEGAILQSAPNAEDPDIKMLELIFPAGAGRAYSIEFSAPKEKFDDFMPYFDAIAASFRLK